MNLMPVGWVTTHYPFICRKKKMNIEANSATWEVVKLLKFEINIYSTTHQGLTMERKKVTRLRKCNDILISSIVKMSATSRKIDLIPIHNHPVLV